METMLHSLLRNYYATSTCKNRTEKNLKRRLLAHKKQILINKNVIGFIDFREKIYISKKK